MCKARSWHGWKTFYQGSQPKRIAQPPQFLLPFTGVRPYTLLICSGIGQPFTDAEELPMKFGDAVD
jgi:hypothetical protein